MPEFLGLSLKEQAEILTAISSKTGRAAQVLQKDVWVCWALKELFAIESGVRMVFKGGTSLSKVFRAIHRFSEDVDVTLDYRDLYKGEDPLGAELSTHVHELIYTILSDSFKGVTEGLGNADVSDDGEVVNLRYPSHLSGGTGYMEDKIMIKFGGRNAVEPSGQHEITSDLAKEVPALSFPVAKVPVLSPERTFWEKATLIHVECHRERVNRPERIARHWYDLVMLFDHEIGQRALADRELLRDVVKYKNVFFNASYANYGACLSGGFRLIPEGDFLNGLKRDFTDMEKAGIFEDPPPSFEKIIEVLKKVENAINS